MGLDLFTIEFDSPSKSYFPGQAVTGRIIVVCNSSKNVQGLRVKFEGKASVYWTEEERETTGTGDNREERTTTRVYDDSDNFFDYKFYCLGDERSEVAIPAGRNEYPFTFSLPPALPSSFIGQYGKVTYEIQALMKRSWKFDHEIKSQFTVNALADLNNDPIASQPGELQKNKTLCCLCCASGPVGVLLRIPRKGYCPGEFISIVAELQNNSRRHITGVSLSLVQTATFYAKGRSKVSTKTVAEVKRPGVGPGDTDIWRGDLLQIPSIPPTKLGNCHLIDVQYQLHIAVSVSGPSMALKGSLPIQIGNIPLRSFFQDLTPRYTIVPSAPPIIPAYPDMPPPSYKDSMYFGPEKPQPTMVDTITTGVINQMVPKKEEEYVPQYPSYGWNVPSN